MKYISADDVTAFCLNLMNKMPGNLIMIMSCAIFRWCNPLGRFPSWFSSRFWSSQLKRKKFINCLIYVVKGISANSLLSRNVIMPAKKQ